MFGYNVRENDSPYARTHDGWLITERLQDRFSSHRPVLYIDMEGLRMCAAHQRDRSDSET